MAGGFTSTSSGTVAGGGSKGSTSFGSNVRAVSGGGADPSFPALTGMGPGGPPDVYGLGTGGASGNVNTPGAAIPAMGQDGGEKALGSAQAAYGMSQSVEDLGKTLYSDSGPTGSNVAPKSSFMNSKLAGQIDTGVSGGMGMFAAVEGNGGFGGALSGAASGAKLGSLLGPEGALIGAGVGAIIGAIGFGGAEKAKQYEKKQVRPRIEADELGFGMGSMDYSTAYDDLTKLDVEARTATKKWGPGGTGEYLNRISPEIKAAQAKLTSEQKAGRSQYGMTAAEHHGGGQILGFGDYSTSPDEGWIHAKKYETVMHSSATAMHGDALGLMLAGANRQQMSSYYGAQQMQPTYRSTMQQAAFGAGGGHTFNNGHTYNISAMGPRDVAEALMANKHSVRGAVNASYAENSGGSDLG